MDGQAGVKLNESQLNIVYATYRDPYQLLGALNYFPKNLARIINNTGGDFLVSGPTGDGAEMQLLKKNGLHVPQYAIDASLGLPPEILAAGSWRMITEAIPQIYCDTGKLIICDGTEYIRTKGNLPLTNSDDDLKNKLRLYHVNNRMGVHMSLYQDAMMKYRDIFARSKIYPRNEASILQASRIEQANQYCDGLITDVMPAQLPIKTGSVGCILDYVGPFASLEGNERQNFSEEMRRVLMPNTGMILLGILVQDELTKVPDYITHSFPKMNATIGRAYLGVQSLKLTY